MRLGFGESIFCIEVLGVGVLFRDTNTPINSITHCFMVRGIISSHVIELTSLLADLDIISSKNPVAKHTSFNPVDLYDETIGLKYFGLLLLILN